MFRASQVLADIADIASTKGRHDAELAFADRGIFHQGWVVPYWLTQMAGDLVVAWLLRVIGHDAALAVRRLVGSKERGAAGGDALPL